MEEGLIGIMQKEEHEQRHRDAHVRVSVCFSVLQKAKYHLEDQLLLFCFVFIWRIISVQCFVGFCHTSVRTSHTSCVHAMLIQSCLTLCDPMGGSPPGSSVHGTLQARMLEWIAMPSSRGSSQPRD